MEVFRAAVVVRRHEARPRCHTMRVSQLRPHPGRQNRCSKSTGKPFTRAVSPNRRATSETGQNGRYRSNE